MTDISLWEAMRKLESLSPRWDFTRKYGHFHLFFETTTPDGPVSALIEEGYSSVGTSSPITYRGFRVTITLDGRVMFLGHYNIEHKSGWFGGNPKPIIPKSIFTSNNTWNHSWRKSRQSVKRPKERKKKRSEQKNLNFKGSERTSFISVERRLTTTCTGAAA